MFELFLCSHVAGKFLCFQWCLHLGFLKLMVLDGPWGLHNTVFLTPPFVNRVPFYQVKKWSPRIVCNWSRFPWNPFAFCTIVVQGFSAHYSPMDWYKSADAWVSLRGSDLVGLRCGLSLKVFESSRSESDLLLRLPATALGGFPALCFSWSSDGSFLE